MLARFVRRGAPLAVALAGIYIALIRPWRPQISCPPLRWCLALALLVLVAPLGATAPRVQAQEARLVWSRVAGIPENHWLQDVVMVGPEAAWAVGHEIAPSSHQGVVYRLRLVDGRWQATHDASFDQVLFAVAALDAERVVVAGDAGLIARRDRTGAWSSEGPNAMMMRINAIQLFDERAGWAFGSVMMIGGGLQAVALRYSNGQWQEATIEDAEPGTYVNAVHVAPGAGWAVGSHLWRLSGNRWRRERNFAFCSGGNCEQRLSGVRVIDAEHAWLVGTQLFHCMLCADRLAIGWRDAGGWHNAFPAGIPPTVLPRLGPGYDDTALSGLAFAGPDAGLAVGFRVYQNAEWEFTPVRFALRYSGGAWRYEPLGSGKDGAPTHVAMADATHALVVGSQGLLLSYGYGEQASLPPEPPGVTPARPVPDPGEPGVRYFATTGHTLRGVFRHYWETHGGLAIFGYPLTEEFSATSIEDGKAYTVQYFERARFEFHPEHAGTPHEVLLGLLGRWATAGRMHESPFQPVGPGSQPGARYFAETGHTLAPEFACYWQDNGGLALYGYPISEPFVEVNAADGNSYLVQYFERSRLEYHPGSGGAPGTVQPGLLGSDYLRARGWR